MANWDNQNTREQQEGATSRHDNGMLDGFDQAGVDMGLEFVGYPLPACFYKPVYMLPPAERGMVFGYWLKVWLAQK